MPRLTHSSTSAEPPNRPNIPHAVSALIDQYRRFLRTSYRFADEHLRVQFDEHLAAADVIVKGPYLTLARDFVRGRSLRELVAAGECAEELLAARWAFGDEPLYIHQELALLTARQGRSLVVTTGTGSGKTESFLLPLLDGIVQRKREGVSGVQAVLLYPMNALANDQLERLRRLLRGTGLDVSFGLYTGDSDAVARTLAEEPAENERTTREAIRRSPPDILLTNYKQLEFLLVRRDDRALFGPSLRYLVLDELHSYRGALATEIACLIRRLVAHAGLLPGDLLCLGTSATVASQADGAGALARFATTLLGEPIAEEAILGESLVEPADEAPAHVPPLPDLTDEDLSAIDPSSDAAVVSLAERLTGRRCPTEGPIAARVTAILAGNRIVQALEAAAAKPLSLGALVERLRESVPERAGASDSELRREIEAYLLAGSVGTEDDPPRLRPKLHTFFHGIYDVALCLNPECRTLVPHGSANCPRCMSLAWPAALCRTCGQDFVKVHFPSEDASTPVGSGDFFSDAATAFLTHGIRDLAEGDDEDAAEESEQRVRTPRGWDEVGVCTACGRLGAGGGACPKCQAPTVAMHMARGSVHTCPACGDIRTRGDVVTPLRTGTASSVSVLATHHLDHLHGEDRKLLVFADNRQDAAHQAGYTQDKHRIFALRHLIVSSLERAPDHTLHLEELPQLLLDEYRRLGFLASKPAKPERDRWLLALSYLTAQEFTRRGGQRIALEQLGLVGVEYEFLEELGEDPSFVAAATDAGLGAAEALTLVRAVLDVMRRQGAVTFPFFQEYVDPNRKHQYRQLEGEPFRISFSDRDRKPRAFALDRPDHIRKAHRLEGFTQENLSAGQLTGTQKLAKKLVGERQAAALFLERVVPLMTKHGILEPVPDFPIPAKERTAALVPLQIRKEVVRLRSADSGYRCNACQTWRPYRLAHCPKPRCGAGSPSPTTLDTDNYYVRLYRHREPDRMLAAEHSAHVGAEERARRETAFKGGRLDALVCTPTLELGVDIGPLLTVVLRNAPPTPANYAQRVGRAGRRLRIGFASTYCLGSAHDRHVFEDPTWLVAGRFAPPRIRLDNRRIIDRHLRSFLLANLSGGLPRLMGELLDNLVAPTAWKLELIQPLIDEVAGRRAELTQRLSSLFERDREAGRLEGLDELHVGAVVDGFADKMTQTIERWWQRVQRLDREYHDFAQIGSPRHDNRKASARQHAYRELTQDHERAYTLNYLSTQDVLPAYQFPLDSFTLDPGVTDTGLLHRPAAIAIEEFAPGNFVYANGHKLKSIRVLFAGGPGRRSGPSGGTDAERAGRLQSYHFCGVCDEGVEAPANTCPRCASDLPSAVDVLFADAFEAEESLRIGSDEESRQRQFQDRRDRLLRPADCRTKTYAYPLAPVETVGLAEILVTNWGRRPRRGVPGERFWICPECGRHLSLNPILASQDKQLEKRLDEERAAHSRFCAGQHAELVLGYRYRADALVLTVPTRGDLQEGQPATASPTLVTLTEALLAGAASLLELEPGELGAFPRRSPPGMPGDEIVVYENVPGGAGYVEQIAERLPAVASAAMERLYGHDCVRACYLCLKHYRNQAWHAAFDKDVVRDVLRILATLDPQSAEAGQQAAPAAMLQGMLREREREGTTPTYDKGPIEEILLAELTRRSDLPPAVRDLEVRDGTTLVTVPDFAWPDVKLAVYCDGYAYHGNVETLALDARKRNWLQAQGWMVLTFWGRTIMKAAAACAADVHAAYKGRARTSPVDPAAPAAP